MFYDAKVYFNTVDLFAWTVIVVVISVLFEKGFLALLKGGLWEVGNAVTDLILEHISKRYGDHVVLEDFSARFPAEAACIMGPSGCGKTTLLRDHPGAGTA